MQLLFERCLDAIALCILASSRVSILHNRNELQIRRKCLFPHHEVDEQPNQKPKKGYYSHKRRESDDKNAVAVVKLYHNWVASRKTRMHWFLKEENSLGMQKVLGSIRKIPFTKSTLRQASIREKKGPSRGKIHVKNPHQRSHHAMKFEDRSHEETERQQRCPRSEAWNLARVCVWSASETLTLLSWRP